MALLQGSSGSSEEVQVLPYGCWVLHDRVNGFWIDDPEEPWSKATLNHKAPVAVDLWTFSNQTLVPHSTHISKDKVQMEKDVAQMGLFLKRQ